MKCVIALGVALASGLVMATATGSARAAPAYFTCTFDMTNNVRVITLPGVQTTSSKAPVNIPGAVFRFTPSDFCLMVEVTGQVHAAASRAMRLRVTVTGGNSDMLPHRREIHTETAAYDGRSATFFVLLSDLGRPYTVRVQFMSANGKPVSLAKGMILFHYGPSGS
jgi:hypothetical protein